MMTTEAVPERCPRCAAPVARTEKHTGTGRDLQEYSCTRCTWSQAFDLGQATWTAHAAAAGSRDGPARPWWKFWAKR